MKHKAGNDRYDFTGTKIIGEEILPEELRSFIKKINMV
jgi:hypothetical protein